MTLTQTAILVKQLITASIILVVVGTTGFIGYQIWHAYYLSHLPPIEEKPDLKFGLLPQLNFTGSTVSSSNFSYSIDNTTGNLPKVGVDPGFEKLIKVYFVPKTVATLLSSEKSQILAEKFNLNSSPTILSDTKYKFIDKDKNLLVDLDTGNFSYTKEATVSGKVSLDDDNKLVSDFEQTLYNLDTLKDDLKNGRTKVTLLKSLDSQLTATQLRTETQAAMVSLWPAPIDRKSLFTANYNKSLVSAIIVGKADNLDNYLILDFTYYPVDTSTFATYPLKDSAAAFNDLKNGKGLVVLEPNKSQVSITSVYLGYFLPEEYSPYLQPIYVFEGPNFVAFVVAISQEYQLVSTGH